MMEQKTLSQEQTDIDIMVDDYIEKISVIDGRQTDLHVLGLMVACYRKGLEDMKNKMEKQDV